MTERSYACMTPCSYGTLQLAAMQLCIYAASSYAAMQLRSYAAGYGLCYVIVQPATAMNYQRLLS